ncbi:MAG: response regulator [Gemmatimonadetes bacterium]|nr:response regulator [Gemmatimonadota bacterium]
MTGPGDTAQSQREVTAFTNLARGLAEAQSLDALLWVVASEVIGALDLEDCVIYLVDHARGRCVQAAAYGPKAPVPHTVLNPIEIPIGQGIVGRAAASGLPQLVHDVRRRPEYIVDDLARRSELAVPIVHDEVVLGVIDSEHSQAGFFTERHQQVFTTIARLAAPRLHGERLAAEMARLKEFYERVLDTLAMQVAVLSPTGVYEYVNPSAVRDPATRAWLVGKTDADYAIRRGLPVGVVGERSARLAEVARSGVEQEFDESFPTRAGELRHFKRFITPVFGPDGTVRHLVGAGLDVTAVHQMAGQLRQAQKLEAVGLLAGGVAHDFNNLLTIVLSAATALRDGLPPGEAAQVLDEVEAAARRGEALTRRLLAFARSAEVAPLRVAPNELIRKLALLVQRLLTSAVELELSLAPELPDILIDPGALDQVLLNITANARDAMPNGGRFTMATTRVPAGAGGREWVELALTDTGAGMAPEVASRVFEPFFTTKAATEGAGLGLASAYGAVTQAGGTIAVESAPGAGTTFRLAFPALAPTTPTVVTPSWVTPVAGTSAVATPAVPSAAHMRSGHGETVLVVEDEEAIRRLTVRFLQQLGYHVLSARRGGEALSVAASHAGTIHLVLSDIRMPELTGPELVQRLREARPGIPALFMSGYANDPVAIRGGVGPQATDLLPKPFTLDQLGRRVRAALDAAAGG